MAGDGNENDAAAAATAVTCDSNKHINNDGEHGKTNDSNKKITLAQPNETSNYSNDKEEEGMSSGFYLAPASTSSEESSDDDDDDDDDE